MKRPADSPIGVDGVNTQAQPNDAQRYPWLRLLHRPRMRTTRTGEWSQIKAGDWIMSIWVGDDLVTYPRRAQNARMDRGQQPGRSGTPPKTHKARA